MEQEKGGNKYVDSKEYNPEPVIQMGLFADGDGIPLFFSLNSESQNEQAFTKTLEKKILQQFGCDKFIYCIGAEMDSENNKICNYRKTGIYSYTANQKSAYRETKMGIR